MSDNKNTKNKAPNRASAPATAAAPAGLPAEPASAGNAPPKHPGSPSRLSASTASVPAAGAGDALTYIPNGSFVARTGRHPSGPGMVTYAFERGTTLLEKRRVKAFVPWEFNRELDESRVARLAQDQRNLVIDGEALTLFLPMPIMLCELGGVTYLMDGQHRLAVLGTLARDADHDVLRAAHEVTLAVCTTTCATSADLENLFVRINSGTPVPAAYYAKKLDQMLSEYCEQLALRWPSAVSDADHPQRPCFNIRRVKDAMSTQTPLRDAVIDGHLSVASLVALTVKENELERGLQGTPGSARNIPERCLRGAIKSDFYLGLRKTWPTEVALRAVADLGEPDA